MTANDSIPTFAQLPVKDGAPPESAWGVFGDDDEVGTFNFATPERVVEAARLVRKGTVFRLDLPLHLPARPPKAEGRRPVKHTFVVGGRRATGMSDRLDDFDTQVTTQWDGLKHHYHPEHGYYNGATREQVMDTTAGTLGVQHWADRIVGRGVLLDVARYREAQGRPIDPTSAEFIPLDDLDATLGDQGVELHPGDILLVRTGFMSWYLESHAKDPEKPMAPQANGIEPGRATAEWMWDNRVAAVAADNIAVEPVPWHDDRGPLHYRLIPLLGMALGELFYLDELAADCASDGVYECMVASAPLTLRGGAASPANTIAIK